MKYFLSVRSDRTLIFLNLFSSFLLASILLFFLSERQEALATRLNHVGCLDKDSVIIDIGSGEFEGLVLT